MADEQPFPVKPAGLADLQAPSLLKAKNARGDVFLGVHKSLINLTISKALLKNQEIKDLLPFDAEVFGV